MTQVPSVQLARGYRASRLIRGGWQSIGAGTEAVQHLIEFAEAGITTFETADTYPGGEALAGAFLAAARLRLSGRARVGIRIHTRFTVPLTGCNAEAVSRSVARSLRRLGTERLDLLQLQCWDLDAPGLVEAGLEMAELQSRGKVNLLGVCNLGIEPLARLLDAGVPVATNQVQYSLVDRRADRGLAAFCGRHGVALLTYGPLAGGFLTDAWTGQSGPGLSCRRYSQEYLQVIRAGAGWSGLQRLLAALSDIASQRERTAAQIALRWVLQRGPGKAVLFGATNPGRLKDVLPVFGFALSDAECVALEAAAGSRPPGDVGELERDPDARLCREIHRRLGDPRASDTAPASIPGRGQPGWSS